MYLDLEIKLESNWNNILFSVS